MPEFLSSLPLVASDGTMRRRLTDNGVAGQAHIKTGLLADVRARTFGIPGAMRAVSRAAISGSSSPPFPATRAFWPALARSKTWICPVARTYTPLKSGPEPMGHVMGTAWRPKSSSTSSMSSTGSRPGRSSLFTKVKMGSLRSLATRNSFLVCSSTPLAQSSSITTASAAVSAR